MDFSRGSKQDALTLRNALFEWTEGNIDGAHGFASFLLVENSLAICLKSLDVERVTYRAGDFRSATRRQNCRTSRSERRNRLRLQGDGPLANCPFARFSQAVVIAGRLMISGEQAMAPPVDFPTLETERLRLREIVGTDAPAVFAIHGDAELMRFFGNDPLADLAGAEALINTFASWRQLPNPGIRWALEIKGSAGLIGTCGLFGWNRTWRKCIVGYELAKDAQGKGYMHEALDAALLWGFKEMGLNRVEAQVHPANVPSLKLLRRLRFVEEGRLRQCGYWAGQYHDLLQYSLLREDWMNDKR